MPVQTLEQDARKKATESSSKPDDPEWIEAQQALAKGEHGLFWEKCFAPLTMVMHEFFATQREFNKAMLAKMQAKQELGEIYEQVGKRLNDGEWDKCRGLPREQQRAMLREIYNEELVIRMQQDVLNRNRTEADWEEHRLRRIELIQWSTLIEKTKWLEFYNQPSPDINLSEGENHARQTQEHPQTNEQ